MNASDLAAQIVDLKPKDEGQTGLVTLTFGAVYAAAKAVDLSYSERDDHRLWSQELSQQALQHASALAKHRILPLEGQWLAGFYFNDAIIRTDIAFERTTRYLTGLHNESVADVRVAAERRGFPKAALDAWRSVRNEINRWKHRDVEDFVMPTTTVAELFKAVGELIRGVEWTLSNT